MPTDLKDTTGGRKGETWGGFGLGCILKQVLTGTVCFPLGSEFGCGTEKEIGVEKEQSVELKLGAGEEGVGSIEVTIGTKTTKSEKWTAHSEKCQWCKPEICFPNSSIETWTCYGVWTLYRHGYDKTYFYPGPTSELSANCEENKAKCKCTEQASTATTPREGESGGRSESTNSALHTMLLRPVHFSRENQTAPSEAAATADAFASLYHEDLMHPRFAGRPSAIGVAESGEAINWLHPATHEAVTISLLSTNCGDSRGSGVPSVFHGRFLPVLAALPCVPKAKPEIVATITAPGKQPRRMTAAPQTRTGLFTLLWAEFDLGAEAEPGTKIGLELKVVNDDGCVAAFTTAAYTVLA
jgi:hypothetical protein